MKYLTTLLVGLLAGTAQAGESKTLKLVNTITVSGIPGRFHHPVVDPKAQRLFLGAHDHNSVQVVDLKAGRRNLSLSGLRRPTGMLFLADRNQLFVACNEEAKVRMYDCATFAEVNALMDLPDTDCIRHFGDYLLAGYNNSMIGIINLKGPGSVGDIKLPGRPESFLVDKTGKRLFVNVPSANQVAVLDFDNRSVSTNWMLKEFKENFAMAMDEASNRLFVACRKPARLVVLDLKTGKLVKDLEISGDTDDVFYDAKLKRIYAAGGEGFLSVIEQQGPDEYKSLERIATAPGARTCFFSPELDSLFLVVPQQGEQPAEVRVYRPQP